ncbi:MAG: hypothetical protein AAFX06_23965 [Planctomycetota bacterium]
MSLYRNRYFFVGVLLVLLGLQFRRIESFVLNEPTTRFVAKMANKPIVDNSTTIGSLFEPVTPPIRKRVTPPRWLGLSLLAVGGVMTLHALSIPRHRD